MYPEGKKFGRGPRELSGALDLINHYKLLPHHNFFCKRSLPLSISDTHYLHNVVGEGKVRKGEGMQLGQLLHDTSYSRGTFAHIHPFGIDILGEAFQLRETAPIDLSPAEQGIPTIVAKCKNESKDKERKQKRHKNRNEERDKEHKKHKHHHENQSKGKDRDRKKDKCRPQNHAAEHSKRQREGHADTSMIDIHGKSVIDKTRIVNLFNS